MQHINEAWACSMDKQNSYAEGHAALGQGHGACIGIGMQNGHAL
jgi:hypothetical protein